MFESRAAPLFKKWNDFFFYYGLDYVSSVAFPGLVREPGCNECGHYTSVTVLACARALSGTVIKLEQFIKRSRRSRFS